MHIVIRDPTLHRLFLDNLDLIKQFAKINKENKQRKKFKQAPQLVELQHEYPSCHNMLENLLTLKYDGGFKPIVTEPQSPKYKG